MRSACLARVSFFLLLPLLLLTACGDAAPERGSDAAAEVAAAVAGPDSAYFDTIAWQDTRAAVHRGATVYMYSCAKCHGDLGRGDGGYRLKGHLVRPPSMQGDDWRFAEDLEGLRIAVYRGGQRGMPCWGKTGLQPRDMDAVAHYIMRGLRAET